MKRCTKCRQIKELSEFGKQKASKDGHRHMCKLCIKSNEKKYRDRNLPIVKARKKAWYLANKNKILAARKIYWENNKDVVSARNKSYQQSHTEDVKEYQRKYSEANNVAMKAYKKTWYLFNKDKHNARSAAWKKANPEKVRATNQVRRAIKYNVTIEKVLPTDVFIRDKWVCGICSSKINKKLKWPHPKSISLDHVIPLIKGGDHAMANCQAAHLECNVCKQATITTLF